MHDQHGLVIPTLSSGFEIYHWSITLTTPRFCQSRYSRTSCMHWWGGWWSSGGSRQIRKQIRQPLTNDLPLSPLVSKNDSDSSSINGRYNMKCIHSTWRSCTRRKLGRGLPRGSNFREKCLFNLNSTCSNVDPSTLIRPSFISMTPTYHVMEIVISPGSEVWAHKRDPNDPRSNHRCHQVHPSINYWTLDGFHHLQCFKIINSDDII